MPNEPPFDPCRQWLGIDAVELGNARRVLGVAAGETDPVAVVRAADARLNLLRNLSPGPFEMARAALVKRVEEARDKLLSECAASPPPSPRSGSGFAMPAPPAQWSAPPPPPRPAAPAAPPPVPGQAVPPPGLPDAAAFPESIRIRTTVYRKRTPWVGITLAVLGLAGAAGGLSYYTFKIRPQQRRGAVKELAKADRRKEARDESDEVPLKRGPMPRPEPRQEMPPQDEKPARDDDAPNVAPPPDSERKPARKPRPAPAMEQRPAPASEPPAAPEMPAEERPAAKPPAATDMADDLQDDATDKRLTEVLEALRRGAPAEETRPLLEAAFKGATSALGRRRVEAWQQLAAYYRGFLDFRDKALAAVASGDEFDVKSQRIIVSEIDDEVFKFRAAGQNKTVPRDKIPSGILLAIVTRFLENGANPANDLYVGAYHLAKPASDAALAREHWERAEAGGADAAALLRLLEDPLFEQNVATE
jgi:hypothetical protein